MFRFMVKTKQRRWLSKYIDDRNWKIYQKELVLQGEFFFDLQFLENWDDELKKMNLGKKARPIYFQIVFLRG